MPIPGIATNIVPTDEIPEGLYIIRHNRDAQPGDRIRHRIRFYRTSGGAVLLDHHEPAPDDADAEAGYRYGTVTSGVSWGSLGVVWDGASHEEDVSDAAYGVDVLRPIPGRKILDAAREGS